MCLLTYIPEGVPATEELIEELFNGCTRNPDGFGWGIVSNDKTSILTFHSMDAIAALEAFQGARETNTGHALFHSRWATHGELTPSGGGTLFNVHPFKVAKDPMTYMAHNGVLPASTWPSNGDRRSDTHIFVQNHLRSWGMALDSKKFTDHVGKFIGSSNKLVFLTVNPRYQANVYVFGENHGTWSVSTGAWHSNDAFRYAYTAPSTTSRSSMWGPDGSGWGDEYDEFPSLGAAYMRKRGNAGGNSEIVPGRMTPEWLPGRQVERAASVDNWVPFRSPGQRTLTEADVVAAHGYVPSQGEIMDLDEECKTCGSHEYDTSNFKCASCGDPGFELDHETLEACPTCGSFGQYDSTWQACTACMSCGACKLNIAIGDCTCYVPEFLRYKFGADV